VRTGVFKTVRFGFQAGAHCQPPEGHWLMSLKKTDLEKNKASKLMGQMRHGGVPGRFAQGAAQALDRREQRKLDQAAGLVSFATKLNEDLVRQIKALAAERGLTENDFVDQVVRAGLDQLKETQG
jgi:hypothetical protein